MALPTFHAALTAAHNSWAALVVPGTAAAVDVQALARGGWGLYTCRSGTVSTSLRGGWTADGYVEYDKVGDGHGRQVWELTGSPAIN